MSEANKLWEEHFDPAEYLNLLIGGEDYEHKFLFEDVYHRAFSEGLLRGKNLLDVGCGPLFRPALSGSAFIPEIHLCDLVEKNRKMIEKWLKRESDAPDYTPLFKHVAKLEGKTDYKYLEERARESIKEIFHCDLLSDNPLHPRTFQQYDIVTATGVLDCFPDEKEYYKAFKNLVSLIKPGGHLFFFATLEASKFVLAEVIYPATYVTVERLRREFKEVGLNICEIEETRWDMGKEVETDNKGTIWVLASKPPTEQCQHCS